MVLKQNLTDSRTKPYGFEMKPYGFKTKPYGFSG
jgi:hypothetical protein